MSEVALAHKYSSEIYEKALSNVIDRWEQDGDDPVKYDEAAIGMDTSTVSVALKFLAEIGLLDAPKAGHYNVPETVVEYRNKFGEVQREAKKDVERTISDYPIYDEAKFLLEREKYTLDDLAEEIAGSSRISADKDELGDVKRSLKILAELGFFEISEDGTFRSTMISARRKAKHQTAIRNLKVNLTKKRKQPQVNLRMRMQRYNRDRSQRRLNKKGQGLQRSRNSYPISIFQ